MNDEFHNDNVGVFSWALYNMKQGRAAKRIGWLGYWKIETKKQNNDISRRIDTWDDQHPYQNNQEIVMHCKDGKVVHMDSGCDSIQAADDMAADDWMILSEDQVAELDKVIASRCLAK